MKYNKISVIAFILVPTLTIIAFWSTILFEDSQNIYTAQFNYNLIRIIHDILIVALFPTSLIGGTILAIFSFKQIKKTGERGKLLSIISMISGFIFIFLSVIYLTNAFCMLPKILWQWALPSYINCMPTF